MADLLLDTDVLVDVARGHQPSVTYVSATVANARVAVSVIAQLELLVGCRNKREQRHMDRFLAQFEVVPIDAAISELAVDLVRQHRLRHGLLVPDALVAATALVAGLPLVTRNAKHYRFIESLVLGSPTVPPI